MDLFDTIEELFHEKILLYRDLIECLEQEKRSIVETDVDSLWRVSDKKQAIAVKIEDVRKRILESLDNAGIDHTMEISTFNSSNVVSLLPEENAKQIRMVDVTLIRLKEEIKGMVKANKSFVEEYLSVLDELIGIITNTDQSGQVYDSNQYYEGQGKTNLFLHKEV